MHNPHPVSGQPQRDPLDAGKNAPNPKDFKKVMAVDDSDAEALGGVVVGPHRGRAAFGNLLRGQCHVISP